LTPGDDGTDSADDIGIPSVLISEQDGAKIFKYLNDPDMADEIYMKVDFPAINKSNDDPQVHYEIWYANSLYPLGNS